MVDDHKDDNLCRLCGQTKTTVVDIFNEEQQQLAIDKKIIKCLQIKIEASDILPVTICIDCLNLLDKYYDFYEKTNQTQLLLTQFLIKKTNDLLDNQKNNETAEQDTTTIDNLEVQQSSSSDNNDEDDDDDDENVDEKLNSSQKKIKKTNKTKLKHCKTKKNYNEQSESDDDDEEDEEEDEEEDDESFNEKKIPDNYMTGTESDKESIIKSKKNNNIKELIDRYHWLCTDCNDKLASLDLLVEHHKKCHNQQPKYMCVKCCKVYDKYYGFLIHVKRHKNKSKYNCQDCDKTFIHKKVLETHRSSVHNNEKNKFICSTCGKIFRQQSALYIHSRCHLPDNIKNRYPCDECGKRFTTKPNLVTHKRIHSGVRNFTCDQCGKSFIQKGNLEAHFLTHSIDKPHSCLKCLKSFKTPLQLKKHETVHTGIKQHICNVCNKSFREKGTLREHTRIHTGAMPFTCEYCGKSFRFKGILTTHRRQHTGERPYSCIECQHHFTNWPNYNKHMKRRHGINTSNAKNNKQQQQSQQQQVPQLDVPSNETILSDIQHHEPPATLTTTASNIHLVQNVAAPSQSIVQLPTLVQTVFPIDASSSPVIVHDNNNIFRERNSTYYNSSLPTTIQNYVPYNFYMSNISEGELILPNK